MYDVLTAISGHSKNQPEAIALIHDGREVSFGDLARLISGTMEAIKGLPDVVGLQAQNSLEWAVMDLALMASGRTVIPLPTFFSEAQTGHVIKDANIGEIITDPEIVFGDRPLDSKPSGKKVIYTSGTTGQPKGVVHGAKQINVIVRALIEVSNASKDDLHLSVLPFSLLLEQICGLYVPLTVGFASIIADDVAAALIQGGLGPLVALSEKFKPTTSVLVPQQLAGWVQSLKAVNKKAPNSLRFVAVGGAPVPQGVADAAWELGISVYEGYGLSECCSVVAVNRPGRRQPGTAGTPLSGIDVKIEDGEIVVSGPTIMDGYLNKETTADGIWHTGDLGEIDENGNLIVYGRKDSVIVTSTGRNISPEWIEAMITGHPAFASCEIIGHGKPFLTAVITLSDVGKALNPEEIDDLIENLTATAPDYAKPQEWLVATQNNTGPQLEQIYRGV